MKLKRGGPLVPSQYTVTSPAISWPGNTTSYDVRPFLDPAIPFGMLPPQLRGMGTHMIYIDPTGTDLINLAGPHAGREGIRASSQMQGDQQWPFEQVITNSPYVLGATIERTNVPQREYNLGIIIGSHAPPMTEYQYRMAENHWWNTQDENNDGWLGTYTRFSGWRFDPVRPYKTVQTAQKLDPTAFGNNASSWDITWLAARPYFTKPALTRTFEASKAGPPKPPPGTALTELIDQLTFNTYYWGTLPIANRGDLASHVVFYISSPGQAIVQDNDSTRLVPLPYTSPSVGTYMCDTENGNRTLTAANDPQDNLLFDLIRQSQILDFFLSGIANEGLPLAMTFNNRFIYQIPPKTAVSFTVGHSEPDGVILASVSQRFKRSR
jgi:hypothetical protein